MLTTCRHSLTRWKTLLAIAWPLIIANSFWNIQLTIDRVFLGAYSTEGLGASMAVMGFFWIPMALLQQTAHYVTSFVSQYFGAKTFDKIGVAFWQSIYVCVAGGILFLGLNVVSTYIFSLMGHSAMIQSLEVDYFNALSFSALPTALVAAISGFFTGIGQTKRVMGINFVGLIANVIFDYCFIAGNLGFPEWGIAGAGYATALAGYASVVFGVCLLMKKDYKDRFQLAGSWRFKWSMCRDFLKFGIPSGLQWALEGTAFTTFLIIMGRLPNGDAALAASSIAVTMMMLAVLPAMGVAQGVMTLVGQKLGAKQADEAAQITWDGVSVSVIYIAAVGVLFMCIPDFFLNWFRNDGNPLLWLDVHTLGIQLLFITAVFSLFDSVYLNVSFALKAAGDTRFVSLIALTVPWPLMVLPAVLLIDHPNAVTLSWRFVILYSMVLSAVLIWRFNQGKWKCINLIEQTTN